MFTKLLNWWRAPSREKKPPYRVYTRDFDEIVRAEELDTVLGPLSDGDRASWDDAWDAFQADLQGWRAQLQTAQSDALERIKSTTSDAERADTVVAILVDHSGSLKGENLLLAAATADIARNFVSLAGSAVEVLGFTTLSWRGGKARKRWIEAGSPKQPGRLCDLLHIIYEWNDATDDGADGMPLKAMLRRGLLKENVDGEAVEWAAAGLRACPQTRKVLRVISDGAPVDDSTLLANEVNILHRHLYDVVGTLEDSADVEVAAIGIAFDVDRYYYSVAEKVTNAAELKGVIDLLERIFADKEMDADSEGDGRVGG
jgi:cobaltochelatase CobT